jgi:hypothetical protein
MSQNDTRDEINLYMQHAHYDMEVVVEPDRALTDVEDARRMVQRVQRYLQEGGWL